MTLMLSKSSVGTFYTCPYRFYLQKVAGVKPLYSTDYHRLLGVLVHRFVDQLHKPRKNPKQRYYYESLEKARGAWFHAWKMGLEEDRYKIRFTNAQTEKDLGATGWICILKYWNQNLNKQDPLVSEERVKFPMFTGIEFEGVFDQIRQVPLSTIRKYRPELLVGDQLIKGYDPAAIVDLKTNRYGFRVGNSKTDASNLEKAAKQEPLHGDLQVVSYHWLYKQWTGKMPVGFFWYHLRRGDYYYTYCVESDFPEMKSRIWHVVDSMNVESFPKDPKQCTFCDYLEVCVGARGERPLLVSEPVQDYTDGEINRIEPNVIVKQDRQLRFPSRNFKAKRVKRADRKDPLTEYEKQHGSDDGQNADFPQTRIVVLPRQPDDDHTG